MASASADLSELEPFAGKYVVVRILGQGGMGTVFEARHRRTGHRVAIKVLGSALRQYPDLVRRFEREARACGALTSPNAVKVFDIDTTDDGTPYLVMELLSGTDLGAVLFRDGAQPVGRATRWVLDACEAIAEAHRLGIIHRDLKPSNVFVAEIEGVPVVKVLDFGIAKVTDKDSGLTHAESPLGTPQYMSPEQVRCAKNVDFRTDIWSLGVTLYELVTGRTPFADAEEPSACIAKIAADPLPDPRAFRADLPADFVAVLMKALAKNVDERFQTVDELRDALVPFADEGPPARARQNISMLPTLAEPTDGSYPPAVSRITPAPQKKRRTRSIALLSGAALALAAFAIPKCVVSAPSVDRLTVAAVPHPHLPVIAPVTIPAEAPKVEAPTLQLATRIEAPKPERVAETRPVMTRAPAPTSYARPRGSAAPSPRKGTRMVDLTVHGGLTGPGI